MPDRAAQAGVSALFKSLLFAALISAAAGSPQRAAAQPASSAHTSVPVPSFWDPKRRQDRPEMPASTTVRFMTETDYPPFNFAGPDGNPIGLNVDLARMLCEELRVTCTIQMRRFDTLMDALDENRGDAVIASIAATPELRRRAEFTDPYYRSPARFVALRDHAPLDPLPERMRGVKVAVVSGTAHEAYLKTLFTEADVRGYASQEAARQGLRAKEVDLLFADGIQLAFWLNGSDSAACCEFRGGAFLESRFFGEGIGIAVRRGNDTLRQALNWGLFRLWERGRYADLWLRYFPINPF